MLSVLIPVYREAPLLDGLLSELLKDNFKDKEIVVSIDEPTEKSRKLIRKYGKRVRFDINEERIGKAKSLNNALKKTKGDILLFLDSDIKIKSKDFLSKIEDKIKDVDILDIKKSVIGDSHLSKMIGYEFLGVNMMTYLFSRTGKCVGINGCAFAIKRKIFLDAGGFKEDVISEDFELAMQCFLKNKKYGYSKDIEVSTNSKDNWKDWMQQRKRWYGGAGQFFKLHWKELCKVGLKDFKTVTFMSLFFFWPLIVTSLIINTYFENFLLILLLSLSLRFEIFFSIFFFTGFSMIFLKNIIAFFITYFLTAVIFYITSKRMNFEYNIKYFTVYYFFYSPFSFTVFLYNFLKSFIFSRVDLTDWKIQKSNV